MDRTTSFDSSARTICGTASSLGLFAVVEPLGLSKFIPIVLSSSGANGSFFTSELTVANRGNQPAILSFIYTASIGEGSGTASEPAPLLPGEQRIIPDAISYLRNLGLPIPVNGNQGGTLRVDFSGPALSTEGNVLVRTTSRIPEGRAGLAYSGLAPDQLLNGPCMITGLRQNQQDRSNLALQNAGSLEDGDIIFGLRISGTGDNPAQIFREISLPPGGFYQVNGILTAFGSSLENGWVRIDRITGKAPYYAYGVINDQVNSDGSFIPPIPVDSMSGRSRLSLPVAVEAGQFSTELIITNWGSSYETLHCRFVSENIPLAGATASFTVGILPRTQLIWPGLVQHLRDMQIEGIGTTGTTSAGPLLVASDSGDLAGIVISARTSASGGGGEYGLFYPALPEGTASQNEAWLYGLQQNNENRSNLALVNTGEVDSSEDTFSIELYDGETGKLANTISGVTLAAGGWKQFNTILAENAPQVRQGYAHVVRTGGINPFIAYAVINDGATPGQRSGDGAFIASAP